MAAFVPLYRLQAIRDTSVRLATRRIDGPAEAAQLLAPVVADRDREALAVATLDTQHRATGVEIVALGRLDAVEVHPREVFKLAVLLNAQAILIGHNHPSGDPTPSPNDWALTRRLVDAGQLLGIPVLDHLIFGDATHWRSLHQLDPAALPQTYPKAWADHPDPAPHPPQATRSRGRRKPAPHSG
jgi:DNA repair protein RadC